MSRLKLDDGSRRVHTTYFRTGLTGHGHEDDRRREPVPVHTSYHGYLYRCFDSLMSELTGL